MKKYILAASTMLALTSAPGIALAGGIQIDPTGSGSVGSSQFVIDPGNNFANILARDAFPASGGPVAATIYMQNAIDISSQVGVAGAELTFVLDIPVLVSITPAGFGGIVDFDTLGGSGVGTFSMYYHDGSTGGALANKVAGTGFTDDKLIASGAVELTTGNSWLYTSITSGTVDLDTTGVGPGATQTIQGSGGARLSVNFTSKDDDYVVNNITSLILDMSFATDLQTPFTEDGRASGSFAEAGAGVGINYGGDGTNNFECGLAGGTCDMQYMGNSTLKFNAGRVPEPGTLALLGLAIAGAGAARRRARHTA